MEIREQNKGITLISLIITIVIMLILLTVSTNIIIDGKLFDHAEQTVNTTNDRIAESQNKVNSIIDEWGAGGVGISETSLPTIEPGDMASSTSQYIDQNGDIAIIPKGFTLSGHSEEITVDDGLVIYDIADGASTEGWTNANWATSKTKYNQFVWIPVDIAVSDSSTSIASYYRSTWSNEGRTNITTSTEYTEPLKENNTITETQATQTDLTNMIASIYKYGGYYIGRYEAGSGTETMEIGSNTVIKPLIRRDKIPYNLAYSSALEYCKHIYPNNSSVYGATSVLCSGVAWDATLNFVANTSSIVNSASWGNYVSSSFTVPTGQVYVNSVWYDAVELGDGQYNKLINTSVLVTTGSAGTRCAKNIYDLAGNCYEWTTEAYLGYETQTSKYPSVYRVARGGCYTTSPADLEGNIPHVIRSFIRVNSCRKTAIFTNSREH